MTREENREPVWDKRPQARDEVARNQDEREQADLIKKFLESNVLAVDIFALRREATGELIAPLNLGGENRIALKPGEE